MTIEIKELIQSPKQKLFVIKPSVYLAEDEIMNHPAVHEIVRKNKFELEKGVDSDVAYWYLRLSY